MKFRAEATTAEPEALQRKLAALEEHLRQLGPALLAFSGGVDSTFLAAVAHRVLGREVLAVTIDMPSLATGELSRARRLARRIGIPHRVIPIDQLAIEGFRENTDQRCYHCKRVMFRTLRHVADEEGLPLILEGSNVDDLADFRPGRRAVEEMHGRSPLLRLAWTKAEIRAASHLLDLPTANLPAAACLASRIPYGTPVTAEKLRQVDQVETWLHDHGFELCRARHHGEILRLELDADAFAEFRYEPLRRDLVACAHRAGFRYVTLDLEPYATGRLNPPATPDAKPAVDA